MRVANAATVLMVIGLADTPGDPSAGAKCVTTGVSGRRLCHALVPAS